MSEAIIQTETLTNIAQSIRSKNKSKDLIYPQDMPNEIFKIGTTYFQTDKSVPDLITIKIKGEGEIAIYNVDTYVLVNLIKYCTIKKEI